MNGACGDNLKSYCVIPGYVMCPFGLFVCGSAVVNIEALCMGARMAVAKG
jgi:hypothetical protein